MKRILLAVGVAFCTLFLTIPASARSIKRKLESTLFAASPQESIFLTVTGPNGQIPLLSASSNPKTFGQPIQSGGEAGIAQFFTKGLATEILTESSVVPVPSGISSLSYVYNPDLSIFERKSIGLGSIFNERVSTLGKGKFAFGVAYVRQDFDTFNGEDLSKLKFGVDENGKEINPFSRQKLS